MKMWKQVLMTTVIMGMDPIMGMALAIHTMGMNNKL
jgi:hypothetical protein